MEPVMREDEFQLVTFRLASEEYGLPITRVQEINRLLPITKLPQTPFFMEGVINLRGNVIPVIDLRKKLGLKVSDYGEDTRIIVVEISGQTVGVIVDAVQEVVQINAASVEAPPPSVTAESHYISGVGKIDNRLIIFLDTDQILTLQEEIAIQQLNE